MIFRIFCLESAGLLCKGLTGLCWYVPNPSRCSCAGGSIKCNNKDRSGCGSVQSAFSGKVIIDLRIHGSNLKKTRSIAYIPKRILGRVTCQRHADFTFFSLRCFSNITTGIRLHLREEVYNRYFWSALHLVIDCLQTTSDPNAEYCLETLWKENISGTASVIPNPSSTWKVTDQLPRMGTSWTT